MASGLAFLWSGVLMVWVSLDQGAWLQRSDTGRERRENEIVPTQGELYDFGRGISQQRHIGLEMEEHLSEMSIRLRLAQPNP